jgi:CubicO group peptidase (beta-lactamase class C family)
MEKEWRYPVPESKGGWSVLNGAEEVRAVGGMSDSALNLVFRGQDVRFGSESYGIVVIRHGHLVREHYTFNVLVPTRFDIWSGTKSFTGTAWGLLLDDSRGGKLPGGGQVSLDSLAYDYIPEGRPFTDPRKARIAIRHLLTMTSGIPGERVGSWGMPTDSFHGPFEYALGRCANRYGIWVNELAAEPGTLWDYSDAAMCHLSLAFANITGREMSDFLQERVLGPIGIESLSWDGQGGSGYLGPHTNAHTGIFASAREVARFGYLMLRDGFWEGTRLIPEWWMEIALRSSQELNPNYGYTWWVNTAGTKWPGLPRDMFALSGFRSNRCYVIPSLDLVVARVGSGPVAWDESSLISGIVGAVVES